MMSSPQFESHAVRAIPAPPFELVSLRRNEISALFEHALVSDISRFYGTLYTHAIPWALHEKHWCKSNLNQPAYHLSLGARLDKAVRKGQDNQTLGIPVGPDTSRIIAETVGVSIDCRIQDEIRLDSRCAFRHVDDWYIGFDSAGEAEDAIATLAAACRDYELELNAEKTFTFRASSNTDNIWSTELREHRFGTDGRTQTRALEHYLIKSFQFENENPTANVLNYAVKRTKNVRIRRENWRSYETFLLKVARSNTTAIPAVVDILVSYNYDEYPIQKERVTKLIADIIRRNAPPGHHAEVAWALFLAKALRIGIPRNVAKAVSQLESSVCGLLILDLEKSHLIEGVADKDLWRRSMTEEGLHSSMWLLAYEADLKGWMVGTGRDFVSSNPYFGPLKARGISFYDTQKNVTHIRRQRPRPRPAALLDFLRRMHIQELPEEIPDVSMPPY